MRSLEELQKTERWRSLPPEVQQSLANKHAMKYGVPIPMPVPTSTWEEDRGPWEGAWDSVSGGAKKVGGFLRENITPTEIVSGLGGAGAGILAAPFTPVFPAAVPMAVGLGYAGTREAIRWGDRLFGDEPMPESLGQVGREVGGSLAGGALEAVAPYALRKAVAPIKRWAGNIAGGRANSAWELWKSGHLGFRRPSVAGAEVKNAAETAIRPPPQPLPDSAFMENGFQSAPQPQRVFGDASPLPRPGGPIHPQYPNQGGGGDLLLPQQYPGAYSPEGTTRGFLEENTWGRP